MDLGMRAYVRVRPWPPARSLTTSEEDVSILLIFEAVEAGTAIRLISEEFLVPRLVPSSCSSFALIAACADWPKEFLRSQILFDLLE